MEELEKTKYEVSDELLNELRDQFKLWATFLNTGVGLLSFTLAIACLGTKMPWFNALLSMIVVMLIRVQGTHYFPQKVRELRKAAKTDNKAKILYKGLESEFLNTRTLFMKYPIFLIGYLFLCFVIFSPLLVKAVPFLALYVGK